jgi:fibronectin-binding autotransporter adhesin
MMSSVARRCSIVFTVIALLIAALVSTAAYAQTDYFWNAPNGNTGSWDTINGTWSTVAAGPVDYTWTNSGSERANFGNTAGTVTLAGPITAYGVNFSTANYVIAGGGNTLTLSGTGGVINNSVAATISAQIGGSVGLTKTGNGTLTLTTANTYSGNTTVTGSTLIGNPQVSGSPFSSGAITLNGAILNLKSASATTTTTTVGNLTVSAASGSTLGASQLIVDNTAGGGSNTTTFAAGNLVRGGSGSALVITPQTGFLGTRERISFSNGNSLVTNGILPSWVVATPTVGSGAADFVTYGAGAGDWNHDGTVDGGDYVTWLKDPANNGGNPGGYNTWRANYGNTGNFVTVANYFTGDLTTSTNKSVVNQTTAPTITGNVAAYALKTNQAINLGTHTLTLGNGSGQSGLILNGGASITNGNITFGPTEGVIYSQGNTTLGSTGNTITSNGLTITGLGATIVTVNGNIVDGTSPAKLIYTGATSASGLVLNGTNLYTGGTTIGINNSAGGASISVGNDSAFGTGKVTNILLPGNSSPLMQATGADHTLANPFDLNGGVTFNGTQSLTFTGPINIIQATVGGTRTLNNTITTAGKSITYGSSGSPSTITIGNPVANGGDGVGKNVIFAGSANTLTVINDVLQDPATGGGAASGTVSYSGSSTTTTIQQINALNTYSGPTMLNGNSVLQFNHDTVLSGSTITSGPFGVGTLTPNNGTNNIMQPIGGDRTIANPISMLTGFTVSDSTATGETTRAVTFTGPITLTSTTGRTIANNLSAGVTETIGSSGSPSTITGSSTAAATLSFGSNNTGNFTVVNDVMQDGSTPMPVAIANGNTVTFNAQNTYSGGTNLSGAALILPITLSSNALPGAGFTSGPFGTGAINFNNTSNQHLRPTGANRSLSNALTLTSGMAMDNATGESFNLTFAGPVSATATGRFISNGFVQGTTGGTMIMGDASQPSTITLATAINQNVSFAGLAGPIVVNDVIQDATGITGNINVNPNAFNNNPVTFNAANTFTGNANLGGGSNAASGAAQLGVDTVGDFGSITSGPLGRGTIIAVTTSATSPPLTPFNADRTLSNGVTLNGNLAAANASGQTFNLNLTGAISLGSASRSLTNNMAGTLTLGKSTVVDSTQPVTLSGVAAQTLTFTSSGTSSTLVNDVIQNGGSGLIPGNVAVSGGINRFNNANTYGPSSPGTTTNTTVSGGTLLVNNTSGSGTGTGNVSVTGGTLGGTGTISQSVSASGGAIAPGDGGAGTLNVGTNVAFTGTSGFTVELGGTTAGTNYDQLLVGGTADVSAASGSTLTVNLINGFSPSVITDFTILTATGGLTTNAGSGFGSFVYPDFTHWTTNYTANSVVVHYNPAGGAGSGGGLSGGAVPEPGTLALLICALGSVLFTSPRGSRRRN